MGVHKEIVYGATVRKHLVFNVSEERERIARCAKSDIQDGVEYGLPEWVIERMTAVCDALEANDMETIERLYGISLYDDPRHEDVVIAEYFPMIVSDLINEKYVYGIEYEIENVQEVMD